MATTTGKKVFRHAPCEDCCDCAYFSDRYNREYDAAGPGRSGNDWYVETPWPQPAPADPGGHGWEVEYHRLNIEASGAIIYCKRIHPNINGGDDFSTTIEVNLSGAAAEDDARVCFNYQDDDNYHYVEVEWGTTGTTQGTLRIGERAGGVDQASLDTDLLGPTNPPFHADGGWVGLRICIDATDPDNAVVTVVTNHAVHFSETIAMSDSHVALGAGISGGNTGIVSFDDFRLWDTAIADDDPECPSCGELVGRGWCWACSEYTPWKFLVAITGNTSGHDGNYSVLPNDVAVLAGLTPRAILHEDALGGFAWHCFWYYDAAPGGVMFHIRARNTGSWDYTARVYVFDEEPTWGFFADGGWWGVTNDVARWQSTVFGPGLFNCHLFGALDLPAVAPTDGTCTVSVA